tara:strand:- start:361 stop:687 length:327 start_codon:yes stop_codon:yes gene_type:complete
MKAFLLPTLASALLLAVPAQSEAQTSRAEKLSFCKLVAQAARLTMEARQSGVPMVQQMEDAGDSAFLQGMVESAYAKPLFSTETVQQRQITEFENQHYAACIKHAPSE